MNRRGYLGAIGAVGLTATAGCVEELQAAADGVMGGYQVSDTQTYEGVALTPTGYLLADTMTREYDMHSEEVEADSGATYILTHISVVHDGDSEIELPTDGMRTNDINLYYDDERISESMMDDVAQAFIVEGESLTSYDTALREEGATGGVFPGVEVEGWVAHEIAANFDAEQLELRVTWNNEFLMEGEDEETHEWTYTEDAEVSIDDVDGEGTTIEL
ncbi:uncharacterized protein Nmag_0242 [Natrialba magadii ATCC 43099]|uniref:Uncharacterized protein n=1 Tax=Natrialba magadii (strain ATCC 43099 / DSM 3394 / CCM 3739 / CIP 104546 / IAM 13178 / JCM 8861 / NBRC 102185 / NCIMB 2190 / MS3) TaxID=547559 RepID=D3SX14_NATMM|nr:hypothetical protein [Natrialba magadii]ADD03834.1 uncharacterized protein Nmag_0242 [Natrialba magadii ATCC 43099]ELY33496.1 hypothetical protein C500_01650 [Natrialba magadii ATCC 43099]